MSMEHWWNETSKGKPKYSGAKWLKLFQCHVSNKNPTWIALASTVRAWRLTAWTVT